MSHAEPQEQGERLVLHSRTDKAEIKTADAQAARNAGASEVMNAVAIEAKAAGKESLDAVKGVGKQIVTDVKGMRRDTLGIGQHVIGYVDNLIGALTAPGMALQGGGKIKFPYELGRSTEKPVTHMEMSKSKDLHSGEPPEKPYDVRSCEQEKRHEVTNETLDNPEGLAKLAKKFGINMPPKDTYVFAGEKDAISAEAAANRLGTTKEQLEKLDEAALIDKNLERVPDYRDAFFNAHPGLIPIADRLVIHHGLPKWLLKGGYQGLFTAKEINDVKSLRGIYSSVNYELHNRQIHNRWLEFQADFPKATRQQVLDWFHSVDDEFGKFFAPVEGKEKVE